MHRWKKGRTNTENTQPTSSIENKLKHVSKLHKWSIQEATHLTGGCCLSTQTLMVERAHKNKSYTQPSIKTNLELLSKLRKLSTQNDEHLTRGRHLNNHASMEERTYKYRSYTTQHRKQAKTCVEATQVEYLGSNASDRRLLPKYPNIDGRESALEQELHTTQHQNQLRTLVKATQVKYLE